jgi:hypothetical protein
LVSALVKISPRFAWGYFHKVLALTVHRDRYGYVKIE